MQRQGRDRPLDLDRAVDHGLADPAQARRPAPGRCRPRCRGRARANGRGRRRSSGSSCSRPLSIRSPAVLHDGPRLGERARVEAAGRPSRTHHSRQQQDRADGQAPNGMRLARAEPAAYDALVDDRCVGRRRSAARGPSSCTRRHERVRRWPSRSGGRRGRPRRAWLVVLLLGRAGPRSPGAPAMVSSQLVGTSSCPVCSTTARPSSGVRPSWST